MIKLKVSTCLTIIFLAISFNFFSCEGEKKTREIGENSASNIDLSCDLNGDGKVNDIEKVKCKDGMTECDANGDGKVVKEEKDNCNLKCDLNSDGKVNQLEKNKCNEVLSECDKNGDKNVTAEEVENCVFSCDLNGDGKVEPSEQQKCQNGLLECDLDGNGKVTEAERTECQEKGLKCDLDGNKTVSEEEQLKCDNGIFERPPPAEEDQENDNNSGVTSSSYEGSHFGVFAVYDSYAFGPFNRQMGYKTPQEYWDWADNHIQKLGIHWTRSNMNIMWDDIEPELGGGYSWNYGRQVTEDMAKSLYKAANQIHWLAVIKRPPQGEPKEGRKALRNPLDHPDEFSDFVKATVEHYDGDGVDDLDSSVKVKYWQVGNEINKTHDTAESYVEMYKLAYKAIRAADPEAKIAITAEIGSHSLKDVAPLHKEIITSLAEHDPNSFDIIDIHHWGVANVWKMAMLEKYRALLDKLGLKNKELWSTENGTWEGKPGEKIAQTSEEQASSLIKRYVYALNNGLDKLFWNNLIEWDGFGGNENSQYNSMGLISDSKSPGEEPGRFNKERSAYWCYLVLAHLIDNDVADPLGVIPDLSPSTDVWGYVYRLKSTGKEFYILWATSDVEVTFKAASHVNNMQKMVPDNDGNYPASEKISSVNGSLTLNIGSIPVLVSDQDIKKIK